MNHVVSFSSGLSSAVTAVKVLQRYPDAYVVFMDTLAEDDDNYRFMKEWIDRFQPTRLVCLSDGRTPLQVFDDKQIIPNQKIAPCTFELKIQLFYDWLESISGPSTVYIGFDAFEAHRCDATTASYEAAGYIVEYPLIEWHPLPNKSYEEISREDWSIEPPRMYKQGYSHANCGGCCVKQGQGDWLRTLKHYPERFAAYEEWEAEARRRHGDYAFLRDQTNGTVTALPLSELRQRFNSGEISNAVLKKLDFQSPCVSCGVGAAQITMFGESL